MVPLCIFLIANLFTAVFVYEILIIITFTKGLLIIFQVHSLPTNRQVKCSSGSLSTTITFANLKKNEKFKDGFKSGKCFIPFSKDVRELRGNFEDGKFVVSHLLPAICRKFLRLFGS
jgi:hypothetical protein